MNLRDRKELRPRVMSSSARRGGGSDCHLGHWSPLLARVDHLKGNRSWLSVKQLAAPSQSWGEAPFPFSPGLGQEPAEAGGLFRQVTVPGGSSVSVHCGVHPRWNLRTTSSLDTHPPETSSPCNDYHHHGLAQHYLRYRRFACTVHERPPSASS